MSRRLKLLALALLPIALTLLLGTAVAQEGGDASVGAYGYPPVVWGSVHTAPESGVCPRQSVTVYGDGAVPGSTVYLGLWYSVPQYGTQLKSPSNQAGAPVAAPCSAAPGDDDVALDFGAATADGNGNWSFSGTVPMTVDTVAGTTIATYPGNWTITTNLPSGVSTGVNGTLAVLDCSRGKLPSTGPGSTWPAIAALAVLAGLLAIAAARILTAGRYHK
ncbi:MAG: hypothetical protein ACYC5A_02725 [Thermoleophilia bacterium]